MEQTVKFSVAMSLYKNDNPEQLRVALDSICTQSYPADEIFLVVDGPVGDELNSIVLEYAEKYGNFTIRRLETNGGLGNALRIAIEECRNELVVRMDSDDISAPGRFKKLVKAYEEEPADVIGSWTIGFVGDVYSTDMISSAKRPLMHEDIIKRLPKRSPMSHVTVMLRKSAVMKAGNYQSLHYHEDYYLWARMIAAGCTFRNIPEYLVYVRLGVDQARRHGGMKYYKAGAFLRKYMLKNGLMSRMEYVKQTCLRIVYQLLIPAGLRNHIAIKYKRKYLTREEADNIINHNMSEA